MAARWWPIRHDPNMQTVVFHPKWAPEGAVGGAVLRPDPVAASVAVAAPSRARRWARRTSQVVGVASWLVALAGILLLLVPTLVGYDRYVIVSGSMHPLLDRGSVVYSKAVPVEDLRVGDIITYTPPPGSGVDHLVTHRISSIRVAEDGAFVFNTKGDANVGADPWTFELVRGEQNVMQHAIPLLGYVFIAMSDPHLRMLVIGIPAGIIALMALVELVGVSLGRPRWATS